MNELDLDAFLADNNVAPTFCSGALDISDRPKILRYADHTIMAAIEISNSEGTLTLANARGEPEALLGALEKAIEQFARIQKLTCVHWQVHTGRCAVPDLRLIRYLESRSFASMQNSGLDKVFGRTFPTPP